MKILFVYTNIHGFHADSFGDGIAMIMGVTKRAGHDIRQLQLFEKSDYSQLSETVKDFKPDVVGFTSVSSQFSFVIELSDIIKKLSPKTITVCGGVHTTLVPQCILEAKSLDAVFIGDAEYPFLDFLENKAFSNSGIRDPLATLAGRSPFCKKNSFFLVFSPPPPKVRTISSASDLLSTNIWNIFAPLFYATEPSSMRHGKMQLTISGGPDYVDGPSASSHGR